MGMFDTIRCERDLPGDVRPSINAWLQSKDLECGCESYTITRSGHLVGPSGELDFHGLLNFYTYENHYWFEYEAIFTHGRLERIDLLEYSYQPFGKPREVISGKRVQEAQVTAE